MIKTAIFQYRPRTLDALKDNEQQGTHAAYLVVREVILNKLDYENFVSDMLVEREYIETYQGICEKGKTMNCLLIKMKGNKDGVLVLPAHGGFIEYAAYYPGL